MLNDGLRLRPRFMGEEGEKFFTLQFSCGNAPRAHIVFIPPFGEEMNRCRSLVATQARSFARAGYSCTLVDFYGTGDSQGVLREASLEVWKRNIRTTIDTLQREIPGPLVLWGLRLGGLIALDYAATSALEPRHIILWQPVTSAALYVTQVLRQRVASLMVRDLPAETTKEIRQRLEEGKDVEIAGYTLGGQLVRDIEKIELSGAGALCSETIYWLENVAETGKEIGIASQKVVNLLTTNGNRVDVKTFCDPPIWQIHERDFAPQLLATTDGLVL
ncbi:MAG: hydrolase 2, exosortase A system-associated [Halioglobus sp.]